MKFIIFIIMLFLVGLAFGYIKIEPSRVSVDMGDFDLKIPDKEDK